MADSDGKAGEVFRCDGRAGADVARMKSPFMSIIVRLLVLALGVTLATRLVPGVSCADGLTLLTVVVLLSVFNAVLRPLLVLFSLPFIVLTLGLGLVVINALLFMLVAHLVKGFHVEGFGAAFFAALIVGATNMIMTMLMRRSPPGGGPGAGSGPGGASPRAAVRKERAGPDVIDV